jgi:hypothetical protein
MFFALDTATDRIVSGEDGIQRRSYRCLDEECQGVVHFHLCQEGHQNYFQHRHDDKDSLKCPGKSGGETHAHFSKKIHIGENLGLYEIQKLVCSRCARYESITFPSKTFRAIIEGRVTGSRRRADVLVFAVEGEKQIAVEICHSNPVSDTKRDELTALGVPILEITTDEIEQAMLHPRSDRSHMFVVKTVRHAQSPTCSSCMSAMQRDVQHLQKQCTRNSQATKAVSDDVERERKRQATSVSDDVERERKRQAVSVRDAAKLTRSERSRLVIERHYAAITKAGVDHRAAQALYKAGRWGNPEYVCREKEEEGYRVRAQQEADQRAKKYNDWKRHTFPTLFG